jgi:hypothetical protein
VKSLYYENKCINCIIRGIPAHLCVGHIEPTLEELKRERDRDSNGEIR